MLWQTLKKLHSLQKLLQPILFLKSEENAFTLSKGPDLEMSQKGSRQELQSMINFSPDIL